MIIRITARTAVALLALPVLLAGCGGEAGPSSAPPPAATTSAAPSATALPTASPTGSPTGTPAQAVDEESATIVTLTVAGGKVTGDTGRVRVALGSRVRLTVTADVVDEIHLHGYDLHQGTSAGQAATLEFVADRPGVFEVELEESRVLLTRLQVQ